MSLEEAIIFVADFIEPERDDRSHIASIAYDNLNKAVALITTKLTIQKLEYEK